MNNESINVSVIFYDKNEIYSYTTKDSYTICGEPMEISSYIEPVYLTSFIMDKYGFIHYIWTSQQADVEIYKIVYQKENQMFFSLVNINESKLGYLNEKQNQTLFLVYRLPVHFLLRIKS